MDFSEVAERTRQEFRKRTDSLLFGMGFDPSTNGIRHTHIVSQRFFFRHDEVPRILALLRERMPDQTASILERAEKICRHRFDLLGYRDLDYGKDIDWHSDRVHGKRAPLDPWYKIPYLDFNAVGDAKVTWELNRHQHLVTLAKAYRLTDDRRFAAELIDQRQHWQRANPYPRGINWTSSLEVAMRSLSWLWVYYFLEGTPAMTPEIREQWLRAMSLSGRHIERYLSTYFSPNTHLLGEAVALFFIGTICPELPSASRWKQRGWDILLRESARQVRADGFYFEQSTYYHVYALDFLLHARVLASLNAMPFPVEYDRRLEQMLDALMVLCRAGVPSRWGDDDGGRVFDPQRNRAEHLSDPFSTGAVLFGRGDFKWFAGNPREEALWLFGEKGLAEFDHIEAKEPAMHSVALSNTGLYVMSCDEGKMQAVIDAGPQGAHSAGHGHADALSLTLHAGGRELLGDPGTYEYVGPGNDRDLFRGTAAHNTLQLDGRNQSEPNGPFGWERLVQSKAETWITGQTFDLFVGSHDGYSQPDNPLVHRRWVFFRKPKFWLVRDQMHGNGEHRLALHWHLHPELSLETNTIALFAPHGQGSRSVERGPWSSAYGMKDLATTIRFTAISTLPAEFATLLMPVGLSSRNADAHGKLEVVPSPERMTVYRFAQGQDEHFFIFGPNEDWAFQEWKSDAEFMCCSSVDGNLNLLVLCNISHLEFRGSTVVSSPARTPRCEILYSEANLQVISSQANVHISRDELIRAFVPQETASKKDGEPAR
jgi:hypothetical protein